MTKKLIEVALPLEAINVASAREKNIRHGHPNTLHLWWARRPLAACRAVIFASLVDDPTANPETYPTLKAQEEERRRLFGIIERLVQWENTTNESVLEEAREEIRRSTNGHPPAVLDPFSGGGSIPLEAQRLGLKAYASDLNPVAVLINKAMVEIPPEFAGLPPVHPRTQSGLSGSGSWDGPAGLVEDVRQYGTWMLDEARRRVGGMYPPVLVRDSGREQHATVIAWIWARTIQCPNPACGAMTPLANNWELSTKKGRPWSILPVADRSMKTVTYRVVAGPATTEATIGRTGARCLVCAAVADLDYVRASGRAGRNGRHLLAVVVDGGRNRQYLDPVVAGASVVEPEVPTDGPQETLSTHPQYMGMPRYGLTKFADLFTTRQLALLNTLADLVGEGAARARADAAARGDRDADGYGKAIATYLAFILDRVANRSSTQAFWDPSGEKVQQVFARQALPMIWISAEANPFSGKSGSIEGQIEYLANALANVPAAHQAQVRQADAMTSQWPSPILVSTDPPYYDNVPYADLSDYFYVWLRRSLAGFYPELFPTMLTPKADELVADSVRHGGKAQAKQFFEEGLLDVFRRLGAAQTQDGPLTVFYAFRQSESGGGDDASLGTASSGWVTMLSSLIGAGLAIVGTWPMRTEQAGGLRSLGRNALASSIVLVCRPRAADAGITDRRGLIMAMKAEMPEALRALQHGNIAPVDFAQATIGPGMAIFTRHSKVVEPDGSAMSVKSALDLINQMLAELLSEQGEAFDAETRWAIAWFDQSRHSDGRYGDAELLSKAKGTAVNALDMAGIVKQGSNKVRLKRRDELDPRWDPVTDKRLTHWEITQHLILALESGGEVEAADLVRRLGGLADTARDLAYRLYEVCRRRKWADEGLGYNALVTAWPEITRLAASTSGDGSLQQTQLFS